MQQFRPFLPFQQADEADIISATSALPAIQTDQHPVVTTGPIKASTDMLPTQDLTRITEPLRASTGVLLTMPDQHEKGITEPLRIISRPLPTAIATPSLTAALQATSTERIVVIPGSGKRKRTGTKTTTTTPTPARRMSPRLRQGIVLASLLFVIIVSLVSLSPLANGQYGFPIFRSINNWFQMEQLIWQLQAQNQAQNAPGNLPAPPPVNLPNSQYVAMAQQDAINAGISPGYFVRQINQESGFNPNAVSPAGAVGIAQFLPSTAAQVGVDPWNPTQALQGAARLMASYVNQYGGNYAMALAAYNAGTGAVQYAVNICGANWMSCLPAETRNYIYIIMGI